MKQYCVGIDVGGTTVKCGVFTTEGKLLRKWEVPTRKEEGGKHILPDVAASLREQLTRLLIPLEEIEGIGIGVPGPVEPSGYVRVCVNLGWTDRFPAEEMSGLTGGIPCQAGNDANVAALGELWQGGGKGYDSLVMVTLGTGVGGGVILGKRILAGVHGAGGEIGHMPVNLEEQEVCNCGSRGCLEQYASATGIVRVAKRRIARMQPGETTRMTDLGDALSAKDICDLAKAGDPLALDALACSMRYLGLVLAHISETVDPEVFVIGGGVSKAGSFLTDMIGTYYAEFSHILGTKAGIVPASLGNDAGIYGSARMVLNKD